MTTSTHPEDCLRCWAEVDLRALRENVRQIRSRIPPGVGIMAVLKADAYGHGANQAAGAIAGDVEALAVANAAEAGALKSSKDVLLLGPSLPSERQAIVEAGWIPLISSASEAAAYASLGACRIHFMVDTGMGRSGCWHEDALGELQKILALPAIQVHSVSSHLACADEDASFTRSQLAIFRSLASRIRPLAPAVQFHIANSAGTLGYPVESESMVRPGLALYGIASPATRQNPLHPVLTWKARIVLVRDLPAGRSVSYGRTFVTPRALRMAVISAGYADGYPRQASGRGAEVIIGGRRCALLGRVTMDLLVADVSGVPEAGPGDEVVLVGRQGPEEISVSELAEKASTIPWHVLTGLTPRVTRTYPSQ